jgi:hypothetical protein
MTISRRILLVWLLAPTVGFVQVDEERRKFNEIDGRRRRGEQISAEEQAFLQQTIQKTNDAFRGAHPPRASIGAVPLTELGKATYKGEPGGLYPNGANAPPAAHRAAGMELARRIVPLDGEGRPAANGKIVLLATGMSNTTIEFQVFQNEARHDYSLNRKLVLVDGAQGGQTAAVTAKPDARYWTVVDQRLNAAGVTGKQVQVTWIKQANAMPSRPFPAEVKKLQADLVETLHNLMDRFPNLKIAYLSSRIYGGFAEKPLNPEPHAYESGFAVKWLIADQIAGNTELNYDPAKGEVRAPWLAWGPYLWTDGAAGRKDGIVFVRDDYVEDGTHPSESGRIKVADMLMSFLKSEPTAKNWFLRRESTAAPSLLQGAAQ